MKIKRILLTALCMVLVAALSIAGTIAYLTSTDEDVNVMVMPGVEIAQHEYERVLKADGTYEMVTSAKYGEGYKLQEFTQAKPIYPITGSITGWGTLVPFDQIEGASGAQAVFAGIENAQDKFVLVENTGKSSAYVRTIIALEYGSNTKDIIGISTGDFWKWNNIGIVEIDGNNYDVFEAIYNGSDTRHVDGVLPAGEYTYSSLGQVYLSAEADNEDLEALDGNKNGTYDILVFSQAVQTVGFSDAETALDAAFGDITATNHPWIDGTNIPAVASTADQLVAALEEGKSVILTDDVKIDPAGMSNAYGKTGINVKNGQTINGNGHTLDIKGAGGTWDSGINTTGGLIENITVTGSFRGIFINHNSAHSERVVLNNVTTTGTVYTISCDQGSRQGLTATDCKFYGWTSYAATLGDAEFIDCTFGEGSGYAYMRPYAPTTFVGCDFEAGFQIDARAAVTFENCTIDGVAITADNVGTLVVSNTANATVIG
ncbi:MAG: hypothetical protein IJ389_05585 [Clostridia bacterium]|nr:hypothetical protein [Clostridia bacterium]